MSEEVVYQSGYNSFAQPQNNEIQAAGREPSFYQKLKARKLAERESDAQFESYATPVNALARDINSIGFGYSSVTPQQQEDPALTTGRQGLLSNDYRV